MSRCPRCQTENALSAAACARCGTRLMSWGTMLMRDEGQGTRPRATLKVIRAEGGPEAAFTLQREEATAGSAAEILLDDPFVAPRQARFAFVERTLTVEDIAGGSGVFARLRGPCQLRPGQELRCGRQRLRLEALGEPDLSRGWGSADAGARVRLVQLLEGGVPGEAFPLREGENLLGRHSGDITFPGDGFVSGKHALLVARGEEVEVRDLGSSNGTFFRLDAPWPVQSGDQFLLGRHLITVELG